MRLIPGARVLTRADGALQVGVRDPLIVDEPSADERRFLERLDTLAHVGPLDQARHSAVVERLVAAGLIVPDGAPPGQPAPRATVNDGGALGCGLGLVLARAGWAVAIDDDGRAVETPRGTYDPGSLAQTRQAAAADTIRRVLPQADVRVGEARSDVAVIVSHGAASIESAVPLMARDVPHLYVTADERGVQVGPLVIPGRSACGTCVGLAHTLHDPSWPVLSLQLTAGRTLPWCSPDVAAQAVALAVGALEWWRSPRQGIPGSAPGWLDTVWTVDRHRPPYPTAAPPHPDCGCGAAGPIGDELAARRARMPDTS